MPRTARASATVVHSSALTSRPWTKTTGGAVLVGGPSARYSMRPCLMSMTVMASPRGIVSAWFHKHTYCLYEKQPEDPGTALGGDARRVDRRRAPAVRGVRLQRGRHRGDRAGRRRDPRRDVSPVLGQ